MDSQRTGSILTPILGRGVGLLTLLLTMLLLSPLAAAAGASDAPIPALSPLRQRLDLGPGWQLLGRIDGFDRPLTPAADDLDGRAEAAVVRPWQLASYRIRRLAWGLGPSRV